MVERYQISFHLFVARSEVIKSADDTIFLKDGIDSRHPAQIQEDAA
jgi:hypothetical protein